MCEYMSSMSVLCVFAFFFFFFKQKTAYEMRISDWSSDVCSSDLRSQAQRRRLDDRLAQRPALFLQLVGELDDQDAVLGDQTDQRDQIGRASCRERVCQYV